MYVYIRRSTHACTQILFDTWTMKHNRRICTYVSCVVEVLKTKSFSLRPEVRHLAMFSGLPHPPIFDCLQQLHGGGEDLGTRLEVPSVPLLTELRVGHQRLEHGTSFQVTAAYTHTHKSQLALCTTFSKTPSTCVQCIIPRAHKNGWLEQEHVTPIETYSPAKIISKNRAPGYVLSNA